MTRLTDTQLVILNAAAQRKDGDLLPLPGSLRGGGAKRLIDSLMSRDFVAEHVADSVAAADAALNTSWRNHEEGRAVLLQITADGRDAIGVEPDDAEPKAAPEPALAREMLAGGLGEAARPAGHRSPSR